MKDDVAQLDPDFSRVDARSQGNAALLETLPLPAAAFVASINGQLGVILLQGGSTGYSFPSTPGLIIMTGAPTSIRETGTTLSIGAIANGELLKRSGTSLIGFALSAAAQAKSQTAEVDPTTGDDSSQGYAPFSLWINTDTNTIFMCANASVGTAAWLQLNN